MNPEQADSNFQELNDFCDYTEECLHLISQMVIPDLEQIKDLQIELPELLLDKKLAIFDLDETIIHCEISNPQNAENMITIELDDGQSVKVLSL